MIKVDQERNMIHYRKYLAGVILALSCVSAFAVTATEKAALQSQVNAIKSSVDALPIDVPPPPPPVVAWPRSTPDVLDIDLVNYASVMNAVMPDNPTGGWNGKGAAIHAGDMSGTGATPAAPNDWSGKFSNASCPPTFGTDGALHYLRTCTDGAAEYALWYQGKSTCGACRLIFWGFRWLTPRTEYFARAMVRAGRASLDNQTDLGIKLFGLGHLGSATQDGPGQNIAEIFELGSVSAGGWPLQSYRYDAEGAQTVDNFVGVTFAPGRWYTLELHVKANTIGQANGTVEYRIDGATVFSRTDVRIFDAARPGPITTLVMQVYHGGTKPPKGRLEFDLARIAVCSKTWCGPAPEVIAP